MKNKKWFSYTVSILLTLIVLAAVAGAGFRTGLMQNASFARPAFAHNFDNRPQAMQGNAQDNGGTQTMQGNAQNQGFDKHGNNHDNHHGDERHGGAPFFSPIFGLIHLAVLGLLLWAGYKYVKKSGWRLSRVEPVTPTSGSNTASVEVEEEN